MFYDILERKDDFLAYKNKNFLKSKNWDYFEIGEPMVLVQKWPFFHFFLGNIDKENVFYNILEKKNHAFKL